MSGRTPKSQVNQILNQILSKHPLEKGIITELIRSKAPNTKRFSVWIEKAPQIEDRLISLVKITIVSTEKTTKLVVTSTPTIQDLIDVIGKKERMIKADLKEMGLPFEVLKTLAIELKKKIVKGKLEKRTTHISKFRNVQEMIEKVDIFRKYYEFYCSKSKTKCKYARNTLALLKDIMDELNINVNQLLSINDENEFRELIAKIRKYWIDKGLDENTINSYTAQIRTFFGFIGIPEHWLKQYLPTKRYKGKYGGIAYFSDDDLLEVLKEIKEMYNKGEIDYTTWRKVVSGIVLQHEICCRIQGLKTVSFTTQELEYKLGNEQRKITVYVTITKEKKGKDWIRPIKPEWYNIIHKWLPLSDEEAEKYVEILRKAYIRVMIKNGLISKNDVDEIITLAKKQKIKELEKKIGDRKWSYALAKPSHVMRHTAIHHWGNEVQRDLSFIHSMSHEDPGIYVSVYGTLSLHELTAIIYKLPVMRKDHDEVLKKAKELGLI